MGPRSTARYKRAAAAAAVLVSLSACTSKPKEPVPRLAFATTIDAVAQSGAAPGTLTAEGRRIARMITTWYQQAFVDPAGWRDPNFPTVEKSFTSQAREQVRKDIQSLTIGDARDEIARVTPGKSQLKVTVYADQTGKPRYAVAYVLFRGIGTLKRKHGPPIEIVQSGEYYLRPEGGGWKIFSYVSRENAAASTSTQAPAPSK